MHTKVIAPLFCSEGFFAALLPSPPIFSLSYHTRFCEIIIIKKHQRLLVFSSSWFFCLLAHRQVGEGRPAGEVDCGAVFSLPFPEFRGLK